MTTLLPERAEAGGLGAPITLPALLLRQARERPAAVALRQKRLGLWEETTWAAYARRVGHTALGLAALGIEPSDRIAIHSENRVEWVLADLAAQAIGAVSVGVYPTSPAAEVEYLLAHSETVLLVAEDEEQLDKALAARARLPRLRHIVVVDTRGVRNLGSDPMLLTWEELEQLGARAAAGADPVALLDERVVGLDPSAVAVIVYTSGTTGPPKGAMLSHRNLTAAATTFTRAFDLQPADEALSYLPLCHIAERLLSVIDAVNVGYCVHFGEGGESFPSDLREVQPTVFLGVPRVWEKMMAGVQIRLADASPAKRALAGVALGWGRALAPARMAGTLGVVGRARAGLAWLLAARSLREKLGLARVRVAISGAAPIAPQVLEFFWSLGVPVREGYGQTEGTALATYMPSNDVRIGTVGTALPGVEVRLAGDGEILVRSPGVFLGYLKDAEATAETVDGEGWLHTGDVGRLDPDGYLTVTDRKKDIIITAGGKNVSPSEIENALKVSPFVREAVVVGDRRPYLVALVGVEADTVGNWATRQGIGYTTYADLAARPEVVDLVRGWIDEVNADLARVEQVKRFALLPKELDHEEGELTATQKVKRAAVVREFGDLIEGLYR